MEINQDLKHMVLPPGVLEQHGVHRRTLILESGSKGRRALWEIGSIQKLQASQLWLHMTFVLRLL